MAEPLQSDDEREAQIRNNLQDAPPSGAALGTNGTAFLLRRLDEARADRDTWLKRAATAVSTTGRVQAEHERARYDAAGSMPEIVAHHDRFRNRVDLSTGASPWEDVERLLVTITSLHQTHDARISELLEANNREVERRRALEAERDNLRAEIVYLNRAFDRIVGSDSPEAREMLEAHDASQDPVAAAMERLRDLSCPDHYSFILNPDGSRRCNFLGCTWGTNAKASNG